MTKREIEAALRRAGEQLPRGDHEKVAHAPVDPMTVHDEITIQPVRPRRRWPAAVLIVLLCALALGGGGFWYWSSQTPYSTLNLGGAHSFSVGLDRRDTVLSVEGADEGSRAFLAGRSYRGWDYRQALGALVDDMDREGCITGPESVKLTVESRSPDRARILELDAGILLREKLERFYNAALPETAPNPSATAEPPPETWEFHGAGHGGKGWGHG